MLAFKLPSLNCIHILDTGGFSSKHRTLSALERGIRYFSGVEKAHIAGEAADSNATLNTTMTDTQSEKENIVKRLLTKNKKRNIVIENDKIDANTGIKQSNQMKHLTDIDDNQMKHLHNIDESRKKQETGTYEYVKSFFLYERFGLNFNGNQSNSNDIEGPIETKKTDESGGVQNVINAPFILVNKVKDTVTGSDKKEGTNDKKAVRSAIKLSSVKQQKRLSELFSNLEKSTAGNNVESTKERLSLVCQHILEYPLSRTQFLEKRVLPCLQKLSSSTDVCLQKEANKALALIGHSPPIKGPGLRILSIDGGGVKGLVAIEIMQALEKEAGRPITEMFDFVIGSSTGALATALIFMHKKSLVECEEIYKDRSLKIFAHTRASRIKSVLMSGTKHNTQRFEDIIAKEMLDKDMIDFTGADTPKICFTSTLVNVPQWTSYMCRNYNIASGVYAGYPGDCNMKLWEAIRASSAAPYYFDSFTLGEKLLRDGGVINNNPTFMGIHECKLLWPNEPLHCVVSIGNGRYRHKASYEPKKNYVADSWDILMNFIEIATGTENTHMIMSDLVHPDVYFRFNPYLGDDLELDVTEIDKIEQLQLDAKRFVEENAHNIRRTVQKLKL